MQEASKRPWKIEQTERPLKRVGDVYGALVCEKVLFEDATLIVRAVNTFGQAREALRLALGKLENLSKFSDEVGNLDPIRDALAAMEDV